MSPFPAVPPLLEKILFQPHLARSPSKFLRAIWWCPRLINRSGLSTERSAGKSGSLAAMSAQVCCNVDDLFWRTKFVWAWLEFAGWGQAIGFLKFSNMHLIASLAYNQAVVSPIWHARDFGVDLPFLFIGKAPIMISRKRCRFVAWAAHNYTLWQTTRHFKLLKSIFQRDLGCQAISSDRARR